MMKRDWDLLFSEYDLRGTLENQLTSVEPKVRAVDPEEFRKATDDFLAASIASELVVSPIEVMDDEISVSSRDAQIDVSYDPNRHFFEPGPHYVAGLEVTYHVPFKGDAELLQCRPGQFTLNPPRAVVVGSELTFPYDRADREVGPSKQDFEKDLAEIKRWLGWQREQIKEYNSSLEGRVRRAVEGRRTELTKTKDDLEGLGFAIRTGSDSAPANRPSGKEAAKHRATRRAERDREYDVALSFAGEDREYVEQVATTLTDLEVTVFYDRFETVDLWGKDLADHLGKVYSERSQFVVIFASQHYAAKAWPNHERQFALSRHLSGDTGRILPVRIDDTEIPGIPSTIGYLDARVVTADKLAELIRQKLDAEL